MLSKLKVWMSSVLEMANYDFCPNLNRYVYWMKRPIGWVVAAIAFSILIGIFVGPQGYVLAAAFVALLVLGLVWPWISMKGIRCSLVLPREEMHENSPTEVVFKVANYWPLPVFGMIVEGDFLQDVDANEEPIAFSLKRIPPLSNTEFSIRVTPRRRGLLPCGDVNINNGFPFGITEVAKKVEDVNCGLVWPECEPLDGSPPAEGSLFNVAGSMSDRSGNDGETIGVRSYREGDRLRNIHWAQTVRSQRLMVRERQTPSSTSVAILLDLTPEHHKGEGVHNSFEWAIRIAASICAQLHKTRSAVRVICIGLPPEEQNTETNNGGINNLMDFLAALPTLAKLRQAESKNSVRTRTDHWSRAKQTFFVCTSLSSISDSVDPNFQSILIELDKFETARDLPRKVRTNTNSQGGEGMVITTPEAAACQLGEGWRRSFECASS
jgi:uncharacterized protein (DUF58 family)